MKFTAIFLAATLAAAAQTGSVQGRVVSSLHGEPVATR